MGHFYIFSVGLDVNLQKRDPSWKQRVEKNWTARQLMLGIINAPSNSKSWINLLRFFCCDLCRFRWGKMTSKVHLALFLLFACTVTVSAVEDNFQGENGGKFSQQNDPSYTYQINKSFFRGADRTVFHKTPWRTWHSLRSIASVYLGWWNTVPLRTRCCVHSM